jgi:hypothetical protein
LPKSRQTNQNEIVEERAVSAAPSPKIAETRSRSAKPTSPQFSPPMMMSMRVMMSMVFFGFSLMDAGYLVSR